MDGPRSCARRLSQYDGPSDRSGLVPGTERPITSEKGQLPQLVAMLLSSIPMQQSN